MLLTLKKKLTLPEILPAWMYHNPLDIVERLEAAARKEKQERENKHRRIQALTRKAMSHA